MLDPNIRCRCNYQIFVLILQTLFMTFVLNIDTDVYNIIQNSSKSRI